MRREGRTLSARRLLAPAGLAACLFLSAALFEWPGALEAALGTTTLALDPVRDGLRPEGAGAWSFDLGRHGWLGAVADDVRPPGCPGVTLLEDGAPLTGGAQHAEVRACPGLYSHWGGQILFSPSAGRSPEKDTTYTLRHVRFLRTLCWLYRFHLPLVAAAALGLLMLLPRGAGSERLLYAVLVAGLGLSFLPRLAARWDEALTTPDTRSYVEDRLRPPLYPWFIRAACAGSGLVEQSLATAPALRVVRLQRLAFWGGWLLFAACLMRVGGRAMGLSAVFCFALYRCGWLCTSWEHALMSESLSAGTMFAAAGFALLALHARSARLLPVAAAAFAATAMTRLAGASLVPLFAVVAAMIVVARRGDGRRLVVPVAVAALVGTLAVAVCLLHCRERNGYAALNPLGDYERVAFALEVGTPEDAAAIDDPEARRVFELALARRAELLAGRGRSNDPLMTFDLNLNCWAAACPAVLAEYDRLAREGRYPPLRASGEPLPRSFSECWNNVGLLPYTHRVFGSIADTVLARRSRERWELTRRSLAASLADGIRVRVGRWSFPWLLAVGVLCCLVGRNRFAAAGVGFLASFLFADAATCLWELPIPRYLEFIEWLALTGLYCAALAAAARIATWLGRRAAVPVPVAEDPAVRRVAA